MIVAVCGEVSWADACKALDYWNARLKISRLVHGGEAWAVRWAKLRGVQAVAERPVVDRHGSRAEVARAGLMIVRYKPERLIAIKTDSPLIQQMRSSGVKVIEVV